MRTRKNQTFLTLLVIAAAVMLAGAPAAEACNPPIVNGTVVMPPEGCGYISPQLFHEIVNGLPTSPPTKIIIQPTHNEFVCRTPGAPGGGQGCSVPGGNLGGEMEIFGSNLTLQMTGTGALAGWSRTINLQADCETHIGPRNPYDPVQHFQTDMYRLQGQLVGDPDFAYLNIVAGTAHGMPSPGETTITLNADANQATVESIFHIHYQIEFKGTDNGRLRGASGVTEGIAEMVVQ